MLGAVAFGLLWLRRSRGPIIWTAIAIAAFAVLVSTVDTDMRRKQEFALDSPHPLLNERYPIWQQALTAWRAHPAFGVGGDNFGDITPARVERWQVAEGARTTTPRRSSAARTRTTSTSTRWRSMACSGLAMLVILCAAWVLSLAAREARDDRPADRMARLERRCRGLVVTVGLGAFNTTLHDEHGLLALMMLGIWLGYRRRTT